MKKIMLIVLAIVSLSVLGGCKNKQSVSITLPLGVKMVSASWQSGGLWIMTRQMRTNEIAETYQLKLLGQQGFGFHKYSYWKSDTIWVTEKDMNGRAFGAPPAEEDGHEGVE